MFANMNLGPDGTTTNISGGIKAGCSGQNLVAVNSLIPNTNTGIRVSKIEMTDIKTVDANKKLANIVISFDEKSLASPLHPIKLKGQSFLMSGGKISQCVGVLGTIEMCTSMGGQWANGSCQTKIEPASACTSLGGAWSKDSCKISSKPQQTCTDLGGTWDQATLMCTSVGASSNPANVGQWVVLGSSSSNDPIPTCPSGIVKNRYCAPVSSYECKNYDKIVQPITRKVSYAWNKYSCRDSDYAAPYEPPPAGNYSENSDRRLKKDIHKFKVGLKEALLIQPYQFKYNGLGGTLDDEKIYTGVMAQDLEKIIPGLVRYRAAKLHPEDEQLSIVRGVDYQGISFVLLNAIKEQQDLIKIQEAQIEQNKKQMAAMEQRLKEFERKLESMEKNEFSRRK